MFLPINYALLNCGLKSHVITLLRTGYYLSVGGWQGQYKGGWQNILLFISKLSLRYLKMYTNIRDQVFTQKYAHMVLDIFVKYTMATMGIPEKKIDSKTKLS